jgi:hypothetical protein
MFACSCASCKSPVRKRRWPRPGLLIALVAEFERAIAANDATMPYGVRAARQAAGGIRADTARRIFDFYSVPVRSNRLDSAAHPVERWKSKVQEGT